MSSSTALLPKPKKDDHPIFLRVCHSPWISVNQKLLMTIRGFIATYMTVVFCMLIYYERSRTERGWLIPFELQNVSYFAQTIYFVTTFIWTAMHLYYPHHGDSSNTQQLFSPPKQDSSTHNRTIFSIFYTASLVFPAVVTLGYWCILAPHGHKGGSERGHTFGEGWFKAFCIINAYAINSLVAFIEVICLSSIKRMEPVYAHIAGLTFVAGLYIGWAFIGYACTDKSVYWFLNYDQIGWEYVCSGIISFCCIVNAFFSVIYGLTGVREMLTTRCEDKSYSYNRLPQ